MAVVEIKSYVLIQKFQFSSVFKNELSICILFDFVTYVIDKKERLQQKHFKLFFC